MRRSQVVLSDVSGDPGPSIFVLPGVGLIVFGVVIFLVRRREVTKRKRMTAQLRSTQERLQHLLDTSPAVIYSCEPDKDMAFTFISENVKQLLGYQPEEVLADPKFWRGNIHMEDLPRVMGELPGIFTKNQHAHNYRVLAKSGEYRWIHDQARLVKDGNGAPTEIVGSLIDITQRVESDEARRSAERNLEAQRALSIRSDRLRSLGEMAAGIAHELNQPLTGVRGLAEHTLISLENGWDDSKEKLRDRSQGIVDQADRMVQSLITSGCSLVKRASLICPRSMLTTWSAPAPICCVPSFSPTVWFFRRS
jgi:PAS domain S-box-containing protein